MVVDSVIGSVEAFDAEIGLGTVVTKGGVVYQFHCTSIDDGTRSIQPGQLVTFRVAPRGLGSAEATNVVKVG